MFFEAPPTRPTVLLRHDTPDGDWHHDWLLAVDPMGEQPLVTFRLKSRPDTPTTSTSVRLDDHRNRYLTYEGPLSGGRGSVRRIMTGDIESWQQEAGGAWILHVNWPSGPVAITLTPAVCDHSGPESSWILEVVTRLADPVAQ